MKFTDIIILLISFISCTNVGKEKNVSAKLNTITQTNYDTSIHPLLEIGGCYIYEIKKDTIAGLLLAEVRKEEDSVYYSFLLSGNFFTTIPSLKEYQKAGLSGSEIPDFSSRGFQKAFNKYFISEQKLKSHINKFKMLDKINLSKKNCYGGVSGIDNFEQLVDEFKFFELRNIETEKQIKQMGIPVAKYAIIEWNNLIVTNNPEEIVKPETIWILSPKTANPKASAVMKEEWFWSSFDDLSPFGNDDGADAFHFFRDWRENNPQTEPTVFIMELERSWAMSFSHIKNDKEEDLPSIEKTNWLYRNVDRAVIALAFGQIVLEGKISPKLKELGIKAIERTNTDFTMEGMSEENKAEYKKRLEKMEQILTNL